MEYGLLGKKLGHSFSPEIHRILGSSPYELVEKLPEELDDFFRNSNFRGINVTIPYKKDVIPYCTALTPIAKTIGACNTLIRQKDGTLLGHNTDYYGFSSMLEKSGLNVEGKKVLILGSGGASVTVQKVMDEKKANWVVISRSGADNYDNLYLHKDASVIVNTTPVGMYPNTGASPVDLNLFPHLEGVLDIIYNPARTQLLLEAEKLGLITGNGLWMLVAQAKESAEWFLGKKIPENRISEIHNTLQNTLENIILIGMPGSGKTTVGKILAEKTGKTFVDSDKEIEKAAGMPIPDIFHKYGENHFRELEAQILSDIGKKSGLIIATGGGCITREENYNSLHQNGKIYELFRDLSSLPVDGRPLSQAETVSALYDKRKSLYARFRDEQIHNSGTPEEAAEKILKKEISQ